MPNSFYIILRLFFQSFIVFGYLVSFTVHAYINQINGMSSGFSHITKQTLKERNTPLGAVKRVSNSFLVVSDKGEHCFLWQSYFLFTSCATGSVGLTVLRTNSPVHFRLGMCDLDELLILLMKVCQKATKVARNYSRNMEAVQEGTIQKQARKEHVVM